MKKFAILFAGAAALALSACGDADEGADETTIVETDPAPTVTETAVVGADDSGDATGERQRHRRRRRRRCRCE
jgi:hypothetical protein